MSSDPAQAGSIPVRLRYQRISSSLAVYAGITVTPERSYGLAMIVLAAVGLIGLAASLLLPRTPAPADTPTPRP